MRSIWTSLQISRMNERKKEGRKERKKERKNSYFSHITATALIIQVFPVFHHYWARALNIKVPIAPN